MKYLSPIDGHLHFRGEEYKNFSYNGMNFMALGFRDAIAVGLRAGIDMPNPTPNLVTQEAADKRIELADKTNPSLENLYYGIHVGTTTDLNQVKWAVNAAMKSRENNGRIHGVKDYYCHSTGNMGILDPEYQRKMWFTKVEEGFNGVNICHLEDQNCFLGEFDYKDPITHSERQNPESELIQAERQIKNAKDARYKGIIVPAHTSNPDTIDYFLGEIRIGKLPFNIAIEMGWHHMLLNTDDYKIHGNRVKMNPPLRSPKLQERNLEHVLRGNVMMIGTDQAGHPLDKKDSENPPSGIPAILAWPLGIAILRKNGINEDLLQRIIFHNANKIFNLNLQSKEVEVEYQPRLWKAYGYNPFSEVEKELGLAT